VPYISEEGVRYAVQPYDSIDILPFRGFVSSDAFLVVILHSISWSPSKQDTRDPHPWHRCYLYSYRDR
jgi:hypothetical protein